MARLKRTNRGFAIYGEYKDTRGNKVRVQQSSSAAGPRCWIFVEDKDGKDIQFSTPTGYQSVSPHLTKHQAKLLAGALLRFAKGAE
jgi:hypothetical protein